MKRRGDAAGQRAEAGALVSSGLDEDQAAQKLEEELNRR
jgi:hypothetical protein